MKEELPPKIEPPPNTFFVGFALCLATFTAVHLVKYILLASPNDHRIGFPYWFWARDGDYTRFRAFSFALDACFALVCSYCFARWYWLRRWRRLNKPDA
jgi:hypothetical protein